VTGWRCRVRNHIQMEDFLRSIYIILIITYIVCFTRNRHACLELVIVGFAFVSRLLDGDTKHARLAPSTIGRR